MSASWSTLFPIQIAPISFTRLLELSSKCKYDHMAPYLTSFSDTLNEMPWHNLKLLQTAFLSSSAATAPKVPYDPDIQDALGAFKQLRFPLTNITLLLCCSLFYNVLPHQVCLVTSHSFFTTQQSSLSSETFSDSFYPLIHHFHLFNSTYYAIKA